MSSEGSFKDLQDNVTKRLVETTRTAGFIAAEDLNFLRTTNPLAAKLLAQENSRLLSLARKLIQSAAAGTGIDAPTLSNAEAVEDNWRGVVDVIDNLLEKADACLDEYTGIIKKNVPEEENPSSNVGKLVSGNPRKQNLPKPQLKFENPPKNDETTPFKPLLRSKPHALIPLEESVVLEKNEQNTDQYKHPYEKEINALTFPQQLYAKAEPITSLPFENSEVVFVDTVEALHQMLAELKTATEIAVDLEHHDLHSYVGLVSLMQISTRSKDWIVDTLKPWREELHVLNEVFADPKIVKVLHGSYMDIIWLQRDLGLYVVGLFDTFHAARALGYPKLSLAYLLKRFVDFNAQKQYQTADWRIRPLPKELFDYARSDTHFLLFVFDNLRNELIDKSEQTSASENYIDTAMEASKKETLQRYERSLYDFDGGLGQGGWYSLLCKRPASLNGEQFEVFRAVHQWKDNVSRKEDESSPYVMSKSVLFNIARELPSDIGTLMACCSPMSPPVRRRTSELLEVIKKARLAGAKSPPLTEIMKAHPETQRYEAQKAESMRAYYASKTTPVAQVLQQVRKASLNAVATSVETLKIESSQFWGATVANKDENHPKGAVEGRQYNEPMLYIPLPHLTAEIFVNGGDVSSNSPTTPIAPLESKSTESQSTPKTEVFTLREKGGSKKRKAKQADLEDSQPAKRNELADDLMDINVEGELDEDAPTTPGKRKRPNKGERKAKRAHLQAEQAERTEEPFDYSTAPSVLKAQPPKQEKGAKPKHFDPYSKSKDAPKGLGKKRKEIQGKSATFKN